MITVPLLKKRRDETVLNLCEGVIAIYSPNLTLAYAAPLCKLKNFSTQVHDSQDTQSGCLMAQKLIQS